MASAIATQRLRQEYLRIVKAPVENIRAVPLERNILEWHYVIEGTDGTPFEGGYYHGVLRFPPDYPMKPPSILMYTPNGRFKTNRRLCLSMSDYHPETWNPMWSVSTILTGLYSFMLDSAPTLGSVECSAAKRKQLARDSLAYNCQDPTFCDLFEDLVDLHKEQQKQRQEAGGPEASGSEGGACAEYGALGAQDTNCAVAVVLVAFALGSMTLLLKIFM